MGKGVGKGGCMGRVNHRYLIVTASAERGIPTDAE